MNNTITTNTNNKGIISLPPINISNTTNFVGSITNEVGSINNMLFDRFNEYSKLNNKLSPPMVITTHNGYHVFRDDLLPGGTKQRGLYTFINDIIHKIGKFKTIVYGGPSAGIAQVAMGVIAKKINIKAIMFSVGEDTILTKRAEDYGVEIRRTKYLKKAQIMAEEFAKNNDGFCIPFGLNDINFKFSLIVALLKLKLPQPKRLWVVGGSGVLISCLYHVFPNTIFNLVQVGKPIYWDRILPDRTRLYIFPAGFNTPTPNLPPYKSIIFYDAKLWYFVNKF